MRIANYWDWAWVLGCVLYLAVPARGAEEARGRLLYEARCTACHATSVHQRSARAATSFEGLRAQVVRWNAELGGAWTADEIDEVTKYLNDRYYSFPCPESVCRGKQVARGHNPFHSRNSGR